MNKHIKISIIVPIYNVEQYLAKCLYTLTNQTLQSIEIILVNDCSTDSSEIIIKQFLKNDSRIIYIKNQINKNVGYSRNVAIKKAEGEYIMFVDSDDYIELNAAETLYNKAKSLELDILEFDYYKGKEGGFKTQKHQLFEKPLSGADYFEKIPFTNSVIWNKLWRTAFIKENQLFFTDGYYEDVLFISKSMFYVNKIFRIDFVFYYYNIRNESIMTSKTSSMHIKSLIVLVNNLAKMYVQTIGKPGNNQRLKILAYSLSGVARAINNFDVKTEEDLFLLKKIINILKNMHKRYKVKILFCSKLGLIQRILLYLSPNLTDKVLSIINK